jgi:hypothetical protein
LRIQQLAAHALQPHKPRNREIDETNGTSGAKKDVGTVMTPSTEMVQDVLANAEVVLRTDGAGAVVASEAREDRATSAALAGDVDLALSIVSQLGHRWNAGDLDAVLMLYRGRLVAVAEAENEGRVVLIAGASAQPGLLLRDARRLANTHDPNR